MTVTTAMIKELREATGAGILDCKKALQANAGDFDKAAECLRKEGLDSVAQKAEHEIKDGLVIVKVAGDVTCAVELGCETDFVARTAGFKTLAHRLVDQVLADASLTDTEKVLAAGFIDAPGKTVADVVHELISKVGENIAIRGVARYTLDRPGIVEGYVHAGAVDGYGPLEGRVGVLVELGVDDAAIADSEVCRELAHDLALQIAALNPSCVARESIPEDVLREKRSALVAQLEGVDKPDRIKAKIVAGRLDKFYHEACLLEQPYIKDDELSVEAWLQQKCKELDAPVRINRFARFEVGA